MTIKKGNPYRYLGHDVVATSDCRRVSGGRCADFQVTRDGNGTGHLDGYRFTGNAANAKGQGND